MENEELADKIRKSLEWGSSRYQIDQILLKDGYNPVDIEAAWQNALARPKRNYLSQLKMFLGWLFYCRPKTILGWSYVIGVLLAVNIIFCFIDTLGGFSPKFIDSRLYYLTKEIKQVSASNDTKISNRFPAPYAQLGLSRDPTKHYIYSLHECKLQIGLWCQVIAQETLELSCSDVIGMSVVFDGTTQEIHTVCIFKDENIVLEASGAGHVRMIGRLYSN